MNIKYLSNLLLVSKHGAISKAADEVCLTSQALGTQIRSIENDFGFKIFNRTKHGLTLTKEGNKALPIIESYLSESRYFEKKIEDIFKEKRGKKKYRIGLNNFYGVFLNMKVFFYLKEKFDKCEFDFFISSNISNKEKFNNLEIDLAIIVGEKKPALISYKLYSMHISEHSEQPFRNEPNTYFGLIRTHIPRLSEHF